MITAGIYFVTILSTLNFKKDDNSVHEIEGIFVCFYVIFPPKPTIDRFSSSYLDLLYRCTVTNYISFLINVATSDLTPVTDWYSEEK
jgi:hypothetical protein